MSASNYLEEKLLDHLFGEANYTAPTIYVALFTSDPGETGGSGEVSGNGYARKALGATTRTNSTVTNDAAVEFNAATGSWGTITHFGLFDASTGGNFLGGGALTSSKSIASGDIVRFPASAITFSMD